ncbi:MAG: potassium transporter Kup [Polyangiaceae bacterium]|nr:potassium transporter Kup [Polyangiaceae bacterium]
MATVVPSTDAGHHGSRWGLMLGALGVVYGDIGTSPLYAVKECFSPASPHHVDASPENVLGVLSLILWSLVSVIVVKYLTFIMRADNEGQGGILALLALVPKREAGGGRGLLLLVVLFGAALLYGDGVITPAISVLSAVEGLSVATKALEPVIVPATAVILFLLFIVQRRGTGGIGKVFGPVMLLWFLTIGALGVVAITKQPGVFAAVNPWYAVRFFAQNEVHGFLVLGSVVLCITGGEALYADMGHFGRGPIRASWYFVVMPALLLNYFGQGALLLADPSDAVTLNPFYALVPTKALLYPIVILATAATVVASQALISGAYSLTQQAVQLGYLPRMTVIHTAKEHEGQIYIPEVNNLLLVACIACVFAFQSSTALAAAYGIAVTGTMGITSIVYYVVVRRTWGWSRWKALPLVALFLVFDLAFFGANILKLKDGPGGWFPISLAAAVFVVMTTWKTGRGILGQFIREGLLPLQLFLDDVANTKPYRVRGTAVFMSSNPEGTPPALLHHFRHNQVLHEQIVLLSVQGRRVPEVPADRRLKVEKLGHGFYRVTVLYGFMQSPNIPHDLSLCAERGLVADPARTSYFLGRETLLPTGRAKMWRWRKWLFAYVSRNALPATAYFGLPPNRVVELGIQIDF